MTDILTQFVSILPENFIPVLFGLGITCAVCAALFSYPNERL